MRRDGRMLFILISGILVVPVGLMVGCSPPDYRINILIVSAVVLVCLWKFLDIKPKT